MAQQEQDFWNFSLVKGGDFSRLITLLNEDETAVNLSGFSVVMVVRFGNSSVEWSGGKLVVEFPAGDGKIRFSLTATEIAALNFKTARYFLFLELNGVRDLCLSGTILLK